MYKQHHLISFTELLFHTLISLIFHTSFIKNSLSKCTPKCKQAQISILSFILVHP